MGKRETLRVVNETHAYALVTRGRVADTFWARLRGLIGSHPLAPGEGLLIAPCRSIHTHLMSFPIDVIYLSIAREVVGIDQTLPPGRFGRFYRGARDVLELPAGMVQKSGTQVGDKMRIEKPGR